MAMASAACSSSSSEPAKEICPASVRIDYTPPDATLAVGQRFTASMKIYECHSDVPSAVAVSNWVSRDPEIVTVDSASGLLTAKSAGQTVLSAEADGHRYYGLWVTVR